MRERERGCLTVSLSLPIYMSVCLPDTPQTFLKKLISLSLMDSPLDGAHGSPEWVLDHSAAKTELNYNEELSLVCQPVTMNLIVDQDGIPLLVENENDSPQVPR